MKREENHQQNSGAKTLAEEPRKEDDNKRAREKKEAILKASRRRDIKTNSDRGKKWIYNFQSDNVLSYSPMFLFSFLAMLHSLQDLSSPTRC